MTAFVFTEVGSVPGGFFGNKAAGDESNLIVANSSNNTYIHSTDGGATWVQRTSPFAGAIQAIAFNGAYFLAVVGYTVAKSADGISWTTGTVPGSGDSFANGIVPGVGRWAIAYGSDEGLAISTDEGVSWTRTVVYSPNAYWGAITYANGKFYALASDYYVDAPNYRNVLAVSESGTSWTTNVSAWDGSANIQNLTFFGAILIATGNMAPIYSANEGASWTVHPTLERGFQMLPVANDELIYLETPFGGTTALYTSTDGIDWSVATYSGASLDSVEWFAQGEGGVFAGIDGSVFTFGGASGRRFWTNYVLANEVI
jgi:hypothetical protein